MTSPASLPSASESLPAEAAVQGASSASIGLVAAAVLAAVAFSWTAGELIHGRFVPGLKSRGGVPTPEQAMEDARQYRNGVTAEAMVKAALLGGALGLTLGAAGGLSRRSKRAAILASAFGLAAGSGVAAGAAFGFVRFYLTNYAPSGDELPLALASFAGLSASIGAAAGAAFGVGLGGRQAIARALIGGLLGAALGMAIFQVVGAVAFPLEDATKPLPSSARMRLASQFLVAVLASAGAFLLVRRQPRTSIEAPRVA